MKRPRRVTLIQAAQESAQLRVQNDDGTWETVVLGMGSDLLLAESKPMEPCANCGHSASGHGDWEYDGEDEFWVSGPCHSEDGCQDFERFVPRLTPRPRSVD